MILSKATIAQARSNAAKAAPYADGTVDHFEWDDELAGFALRIRNGKESWIFQYKNKDAKHRRIRLGGKELTPEKARLLADATKGQFSASKLGVVSDPAFDREKRKAEASTAKPQPKPQTVGALIAEYLEARKTGMRPRSHEETKRHLEKQWKILHSLPANKVSRADVAAQVRLIAKDSGPVAANRSRASLSAFFRWAIGEGLCDQNSVAGTNKQEEAGPRERSLTDSEAAAVWLAAPENDYGRIVRLILLTGCRRDEIGSLKWSEIDLKEKTITLPKERTKNKQAHAVPLSAWAVTILEDIPRRANRDFVFGMGEGGYSGWSKSKGEIDKAAKVKEPWTLHDLRRTVRTGLGKLGIAPHVAEAALNHLPPKLIRTYDRNTYAAEKRDALDKWAAHLKVAIAQATGANVTALRNRGSAAGKKR